LGQVDRIACEDTRHSGKLLAHCKIDKPTLSYHEHNENKRALELTEFAIRGERIALIVDAGMPGISDPGYRVVCSAIDAGVSVIPIPGPTAAVAALVASGLPTDRFHFEGFLPSKKLLRRKVLTTLQNQRVTTIYYETPKRIRATLADVEDLLGRRPVVVARELTKLHEEFLRGTASEILVTLEERKELKGEVTLLIGGCGKPSSDPKGAPSRVDELLADGLGHMDAMKQTAREFGMSKSEIYRLVEASRIGVNKSSS
jgi:16S rRNA (cytidine1402-2'-O)-methyltransferase